MEAYGISHAAELAREPRPRVLIAKSVCDYADNAKSDDGNDSQHSRAHGSCTHYFALTKEIDW
jgi:hypothetical protein